MPRRLTYDELTAHEQGDRLGQCPNRISTGAGAGRMTFQAGEPASVFVGDRQEGTQDGHVLVAGKPPGGIFSTVPFLRCQTRRLVQDRSEGM